MKWINRIHSYFLIKSSRIGNSILDWIRSIYFSLLGSSVLNLSLKFYTYDWCSAIIYFIGILSFLWGLIYSVKITKRFKNHEISWKIDYPDPRKKHLDAYCLEHEKLFSSQHTCLYLLWIPAIICIGIAGYITEMEINRKNNQNQEIINSLESKLKSLESVNNEMKQIKENTYSLSNKIDNMNTKILENLESNKAQSVKSKSSK